MTEAEKQADLKGAIEALEKADKELTAKYPHLYTPESNREIVQESKQLSRLHRYIKSLFGAVWRFKW